MAGRGLKSSLWSKTVKAVVRRDHGICHLCFHAGATSADHVIPLSTVTDEAEKERLKYSMANLRAAHWRGCPVCGVRCQIVRGYHSVETGREKIRLKAEEISGGVVYNSDSGPEGRDIW